jgi:hypothetical protein
VKICSGMHNFCNFVSAFTNSFWHTRAKNLARNVTNMLSVRPEQMFLALTIMIILFFWLRWDCMLTTSRILHCANMSFCFITPPPPHTHTPLSVPCGSLGKNWALSFLDHHSERRGKSLQPWQPSILKKHYFILIWIYLLFALWGGWSFTLSWWEGLCVSVILRAIFAEDQAPGRSNQADKVDGERPD